MNNYLQIQFASLASRPLPPPRPALNAHSKRFFPAVSRWCTHSFKGNAKWCCQQRLWINMNAYAKLNAYLCVGVCVCVGVAAVCSFDCSFIMPMPGAGTFKELCHKLTLARMSFGCIWQLAVGSMLKVACCLLYVACCILHVACCYIDAAASELCLFIKLTAASPSLLSLLLHKWLPATWRILNLLMLQQLLQLLAALNEQSTHWGNCIKCIFVAHLVQNA